jgi:RimJ/RimL family protein N-acetyltransferase
MRLISAYSHPDALRRLYDLLAERKPEQSISHKRMPSWEEHVAFVESRPYEAWYLIDVVTENVDDVALITEIAGAVYLSRQREIGIGIFERFRGNGYASHAVRSLMTRHPGRFLANINPANEPSIKLFRSLGFGGPIQITLEKP